MAPSRSQIHFFSVMCESILIGAYAVLTTLVVWVLVVRRRHMPLMHVVLFGASVAMFLIATAHLALLMLEASTTVLPTRPMRTALILLSVFQFVIGDLVLIWRVWVIWSRNYYVAGGPFAIMVVAAGFTLSNVANRDIESFFVLVPVALIVANTSICTFLIAGRIWYMRYRLRRAARSTMALCPPSSYRGAVALVVESGALYTTCQLISLILHYTGNAGLSVMLNLEIPLVGILPTLIIVLVHFNMVPGTRTTQHYADTIAFESTNITLDTIASGSVAPSEGLSPISPTAASSKRIA